MATLAEILALLPDNTTGEIGAEDVRAAITALWHRTDGTDPVEGTLLDVAATPADQAGLVRWNAEHGSVEVVTGEGPILQVGFETWMIARNMSGATIPEGTAVQMVGAAAAQPRIAPDNGLGRVMGLTTEDIPNNSDGRVTILGVVHELNTTGIPEGTFAFSNATGGLTATPTASFVGVVTREHGTQGEVMVRSASFAQPQGTTAARPTIVGTGYMYFDTTLNKPIWRSGAGWVDATGVAV